MYCRKCGAQMPDGTKFCPKCGASQFSDIPNANQQKSFQNAPRPNYQNNQQPRPVYQQPQQAPTSTEKDNHMIYMLVILVIVLVAAVCIIGTVVYFKMNQSQPSIDSQQQTSSSQAQTDNTASANQSSSDNSGSASSSSSSSSSSMAKPNNRKEAKPKNKKVSKSTIDYDSSAINDPYTGFIFENSDTDKLVESDLYNLTDKELTMARNEIFARHGATFATAAIQDYFSGKDWYYPSDGTVKETQTWASSSFNSVEKYNVNKILNYQNKHNLKWPHD